MLKYILLLFMFLVSRFNYSQGYDNLWLCGYGGNNPPLWGGVNLDFINGSPQITSTFRGMNFNITNANIANAEGELLFYTNGWYIANAQNDTMLNGSGLCTDHFTAGYRSIGLPIVQGALIVPFGGSSTKYYLFHEELDRIQTRPVKLFYSVIDMALDSGRGAVILKSQPLFYDLLAFGQIAACRHANGRDWWIVVPKAFSDIYYIILSTPYGLSYSTQQIGNVLGYGEGVGQCVFSPDGLKYAKFNPTDGLTLMDFDRCAGVFSNPLRIDSVHFATQAGAAGASFSSNSRYLYLSLQTKLFQVDTWSPNLRSSMQVVGVYDGFVSPFATNFFTSKLGNDGKIYITSNNGTDKLHIVNSPDSSGPACDLQQHAIDLPHYNASTISTQPFFSLGVERGSICDSLITDINFVKTNTIHVFPNPVNDVVNIELPNVQDCTVHVYSFVGTLCRQQYFSNVSKVNLSVADLQKGIYTLVVYSKDKNVVKKIVKY
ncbi:MAG: T9SS C-terminal target domain-containing protein [Bacteroidetes bacterium]|nr:MAG: T9SS C-terminal target domain-containing protein [Bacteroidota bacterium]